MIRDFYGTQNSELESEMLENGFVKFRLPNNMILKNLGWKNINEYLRSLTQKYRYNVKKFLNMKRISLLILINQRVKKLKKFTNCMRMSMKNLIC